MRPSFKKVYKDKFYLLLFWTEEAQHLRDDSFADFFVGARTKQAFFFFSLPSGERFTGRR